jgi:hypothetical protein
MPREEITTTLQRLRRKPSKRSASKSVLIVLLALGIGLAVADLTGVGMPRVLVASKQILPGDKLDASNTSLASVDLQDRAHLYLNHITEQRIARDAISEGELIPVSKVATQTTTRLASIAIEIDRPLSGEIRAGVRVDVYSTSTQATGMASEPELTVVGAWVRNIKQNSSLGQNIQVVELSFAQEYLSGLLSSIANDDDIALVNVPSQ